MERPQWSTKWETDRHPFPTSTWWSVVTPSAVPLPLFLSFPPPPGPPIRVPPRCEKQATAVDGPDAATTPRNTHPTLQSGRCSRDIACLIGRGGLLLGSLPPPLLPRLCHRAPLLICTPFPRPRLRTPSPSSPRAPAARIVFVRCIPLRRDQATISGTWDAPPPPRRTHPPTPYNLAGWTGCPFLARSGFPSLVPSLLR